MHLFDWPTAPLALGSDGQLTVTLIDRDNWDGQWPKDTSIALLDADKLPFPWLLRPWREGDRFSPLGMKGKKLISDFLADCKLPLRQRERTLVLESGGQVMWVVGLRAAQSARITSKTTRIAQLNLADTTF
jgi:tRNA(Ile)-lysidine synthase